ncbi:atp dependent rna [Moniliophthora roreri MCA 2997]|uniref:RNA helicase n=1 Tax=Moniliophthora roreri (strain MCA 2997) TaxID=1381753 RepID=V2XZM8_MONRO|nr:atp dependent rna [Moniliophthora roreri MCA 2997]
MAKKKKSQLKPVPRGFATTSVPKKVAPAEEEEPQAAVEISQILQSEVGGVEKEAVPLNAERAPVEDEFDPEKAEEQSLQNLVDKLQEKTEKEITRTIKAIEQDRRFAKSLPILELNSTLATRILELSFEFDKPDRKPIEEPEDKVIGKLAITYGALRRLGFSEERVQECLKAINGVELEEAYDWLYMNCSESELLGPGASEESLPRTPRTPGSLSEFSTLPPSTPRTPRTPADFLAPPSLTHNRPRKVASRLDANAPAFVPSKLYNLVQSPAIFSTPEDTDSPTPSMTPIESELSSDSDGSGLTHNYVRTRMKIADLTRRLPGNKAPADHLEELQSKLLAIQQNYMFDEEEAETEYQKAREVADANSLRDRLRGSAPAVEQPPQPKKRPPAMQLDPPPEPETAPAPDVFDQEQDEGGMFGLLEELPASETANDGRTITFRDMALPKHWSGRTPKILLADAVTKADKYAIVTYSIISGESRAKRSSVRIRWDGKKTDEWTMDDIACHDEGQAEQYIATVALHALTYPTTDGFAAGNPRAAGGQTFFRLLPPVFRDLWDELSDALKNKNDEINRKVWSTLRSIIEIKSEFERRTTPAESKPSERTSSTKHNRTRPYANNSGDEQIIAAFQARQSSPAYQEMLQHRNKLPVAHYREEIIETLESNQVLVLSGETGCGKSTQVPTFILEDQLSRGQPCKVYCTEPRRISAISLAQRVSRELGEPPNVVGTSGSLVGYSIRLESNTTKNTRLAFVTNGIALRMLEGGSGQGGQGTGFDEITHIVIDEVHERTIESDFLLIVLKSMLVQRPDLKIILMSATVDAQKIADYFGGCPTFHVPGRTFPVEVRYLEDAVEYTKWTISESSPYARRTHDKFYKGKNKVDWSEELMAGDDDDSDPAPSAVKLEKRYSQSTADAINLFDERLVPYELIVRLLDYIYFKDNTYREFSDAILIFMPGIAEIRRLNDMLIEHKQFGSDAFRVYPLHSVLSSENQSAVFDIPPPGIRKIVIATNIAETGITIPDITCVIDPGKHREMRFDEKRQISRLVETFVAKSNAMQRRGRAGRVRSGLCFHLFTKLRFDTQMAENPLPEMMRLSLSDLALRIKIMKINLGSSIEDVLSRALDPPVSINVQRAISMLVEVRALTPSEDITPMGRLLSKLPTDVHLGKFLLIATLMRCLDPALTIAASLNSKSPFVTPFGLEQEADRAKASFRVENSDFLTLHNAFASWRRASQNSGFVRDFCRRNFLSHQNLQQIEELRQQFLGYLVDSSFIQVDKSVIRELNYARHSRNRNRFVTVPHEYNTNSANSSLVHAALVAGLYPKVLAVDAQSKQMRTISNNQVASFHPSSVNFGRKPKDLGVNHLVYFTLMHSKKLYAWETGPVDDMALLLLCGEAEFKLISNTVTIDRKIRFQLSPKDIVAVKALRSQLASLFAYQFRSKILTESHILWNDLAFTILGKSKAEGEKSVDLSL